MPDVTRLSHDTREAALRACRALVEGRWDEALEDAQTALRMEGHFVDAVIRRAVGQELELEVDHA